MKWVENLERKVILFFDLPEEKKQEIIRDNKGVIVWPNGAEITKRDLEVNYILSKYPNGRYNLENRYDDNLYIENILFSE